MPLKHYPLIDFTLESKIKLNNLSLLKALRTICTLDVKSRFVLCIYKIKTPIHFCFGVAPLLQKKHQNNFYSSSSSEQFN